MPSSAGSYLKSLVSIQQSAIQNSFQLMSMVQDQAEQTLRSACTMIPGVPEQGLTLMDNWFESIREGRNTVRKAIDEGMSRFVESIE